MMFKAVTLYHALLLGLIQGATEFLPISSSGHLALLEHYLGLPFRPATLQQFDIILHAGSLLAILLYFSSTWAAMLRCPLGKGQGGEPPLLFLLIIGTVPAAIAGVLAEDWLEAEARTPLAIALGFLITGAFLLAASFCENRTKGQQTISWVHTIGMGFGQALALVPSISRSGLTLASGRLLGLSSERATEFTFLLGAPALAGAVLLTLLTGRTEIGAIGWPQALIGFSASFVASLLVIHGFLLSLRKYGIWMWSLYLFILALLILGDEFLPLLREIQQKEIPLHLPLPLALSILAIALLLEAAPFTSLFVPGFTTMVAIGIIYQGDWKSLAFCIPIGIGALLIGNFLGYLPAKYARAKVHWKEKGDRRLHQAEAFFRKWGVFAVLFGGWYGPTRSFISIAAGLGGMSFRKFLFATLLGSSIWVSLVLLGASWVGKTL